MFFLKRIGIKDVRPWSLSLLTSSFPWKVFRCTFWMRLWGGSSPKRTLVVGNSKAIHRLETGKLVRSLFPSQVQTAITYLDGNGVKRYQGSRQLKGTQLLDPKTVFEMFFVFTQGVVKRWCLTYHKKAFRNHSCRIKVLSGRICWCYFTSNHGNAWWIANLESTSTSFEFWL